MVKKKIIILFTTSQKPSPSPSKYISKNVIVAK